MLLSIAGILRTILIVIAVIVIVRFVGKWLTAKRTINQDDERKKEQEEFLRQKQRSERNKGKIKITRQKQNDAIDVDFEEINDDDK